MSTHVKDRCDYPENGGGGHVDYCGNKMPCSEHRRCLECRDVWIQCRCSDQRLRSDRHLFVDGNFTGASGTKLDWKIECDGLIKSDWTTLAKVASGFLPPFREAVGVPRGGIAFGRALQHYASSDQNDPLLICDDDWTTGFSMSSYAAELDLHLHDWIGVVAFTRGPISHGWDNTKMWAVFSLNPHAGQPGPRPHSLPEVRDPRHTCTPGIIGSGDGCPVCWPDRNGWMLEVTHPLQTEPFDEGTYTPHVFVDEGDPFSCARCTYPKFAPLHVKDRS